ncbi:MAG: glycerol-3-phosphate dehydrogenase, partial [Rhodobacterales bacterium]
ACTSARRNGDMWDVTVQGPDGARQFSARALVNAAGPWVTDVIGRVAGTNSKRNVRLVKGSHIVTLKFWDGPQAYLVQNTDKRVIFINPYEGDKALIGTTDIAYDGAPEEATADQGEIDYLLAAVNRYFTQELSRGDVVQSFSGVRPLYDDGAGNPSAVTRDYVFDLETQGGAPLLNVFGGKITTFRKLAEHGMQKIGSYFPQMGPDWTAQAPLPGGDIVGADFEGFLTEIESEYPWLPHDLALHWGRLYGTRTRMILGDATSLEGLGIQFGARLFEAEARYLVTHEWARSAQDVLHRRTKENLHMSVAEMEAFTTWFDQNLGSQA